MVQMYEHVFRRGVKYAVTLDNGFIFGLSPDPESAT